MSKCYIFYFSLSWIIFRKELCNELNKIVNEYNQIFQTISCFDFSKDVMKSCTSMANEDKMIDNTMVFSHAISENLKSINTLFVYNILQFFIFVIAKIMFII